MKLSLITVVACMLFSLTAFAQETGEVRNPDNTSVSDRKEKPVCIRSCDKCQGGCVARDSTPDQNCIAWSYYDCNCTNSCSN